MSEEYLIDDRIIIPDNLKNMSSIELDAEIVRLEKRVKEEKRKKSVERDVALKIRIFNLNKSV